MVRAEKGLKGFPVGKKYPGKKVPGNKVSFSPPGKMCPGTKVPGKKVTFFPLRRASRASVSVEKGLKDEGTTLRYRHLSSLKSELGTAFTHY